MCAEFTCVRFTHSACSSWVKGVKGGRVQVVLLTKIEGKPGSLLAFHGLLLHLGLHVLAAFQAVGV